MHVATSQTLAGLFLAVRTRAESLSAASCPTAVNVCPVIQQAAPPRLDLGALKTALHILYTILLHGIYKPLRYLVVLCGATLFYALAFTIRTTTSMVRSLVQPILFPIQACITRPMFATLVYLAQFRALFMFVSSAVALGLIVGALAMTFGDTFVLERIFKIHEPSSSHHESSSDDDTHHTSYMGVRPFTAKTQAINAERLQQLNRDYFSAYGEPSSSSASSSKATLAPPHAITSVHDHPKMKLPVDTVLAAGSGEESVSDASTATMSRRLVAKHVTFAEEERSSSRDRSSSPAASPNLSGSTRRRSVVSSKRRRPK